MEDNYGIDNLELTEYEKKTLNDWVGFFSFKPTWAFKKLMFCDEDVICLFTGNQCMSEDEYVYTNSGVKLVSALKVGDDTLSGKVVSIDSHVDDIYEVSFSNGYKIKVNKDHPFYARKYKNSKSGEGWHKTLDIVGKYVNFIPSTIEGFNIDNPKLLGYLMSDGYISDKQSLKFTNTNKNFRDEVEKLSEGYTATYDKTGFTFTIKYDQGKQHPLKKYILGLGYSKDSFGRIINGKVDNLKEFIKGYFNGDGYLLLRNRKNGYSKLPSVEIGFCIGLSRNKAIELQYLLWRLGIHSYIVKEKMNKSTDFFYRVKVNSFSASDCISILDNTKYPDKFKKAIEYLERNKFSKQSKEWLRVKRVKHVGKGRVYGYECENHEIITYCGMRTHNSMKTSNVAYWNVLSVLGMLPVYNKNINPEDPIRILRFASEVLPGDTGKGGKEVRNTQYPEFKKWLPPSLIKKDITFRSPVMTLKCPRGGNDIMVEFVSFNQDVQAQAGVQRRRVWIDEHCKKDFYQEQMPRLLAAKGDILFTLTPAQEYLDWEYDEFYESASRVVRTPSIVKRIKERTGDDVTTEEKRDTGKSIVVLMAATDDNPTLDKETIDKLFAQFGDEEIVDIRRFGLFKQISGRIFKQFDKRVHVISKDKFFPNGIPFTWLHARGIDYHEHNPWAIGWMSLSPTNEAFIWREYYPSPENMVTLDIARNVASMSEDYRFSLDLIDPLAAKKQPNTGFSVVDDLNRIFTELRREGLGTGGSWKTWDTKSTVGRDAIRMRLTNAKLCGVPFNNRRLVNDREEYLPTLWILDDCRNSIEFMKNWKREEWLNREMAILKDNKDSPQQKWSHFNMVWEAIFKETFFDVRALRNNSRQNRDPYRDYFKG